MDTQIFFQTLKRHSKMFLFKKSSMVKKRNSIGEDCDRLSEGNCGVAVKR